jgi:hypothetical protein
MLKLTDKNQPNFHNMLSVYLHYSVVFAKTLSEHYMMALCLYER